MIWFQFLFSAFVIVVAGVQLTKRADELNEHLPFGKVLIGIVFLGLVTSLPEAITSFIAVASLKANDLAVGNILGSNNFNPLLIIILDIMYRQGALTNAVILRPSHRMSARYAMLMSAVVVVDIFLTKQFGYHLPLAVNGSSIVIVGLYFWGVKQLAGLGQQEHAADMLVVNEEKKSLSQICVRLFICSIFVVAASVSLTNTCDVIAVKTGLGRTFVGSILLAVVTSLPEVVVTIAAFRMGSLDLALGNIYGSNMVNMFILALCDFFAAPSGALFATVSNTHILTGMMNIAIVGISIVGLNWKNKKAFWGVGLDSIAMLGVFIGGTCWLYFLR